MQDFIPGLLQFPLAIEWFAKHPDWYGCFKKELLQAPDKEIVDDMEVYTYKFEVEDDKLIAEFDRYGWGISSFEKQLDGKKISIKTRMSSHEIYMGIQNSMTITIINETGENISSPLKVEPFKGLEWLEDFPSNIKIKNGETATITKKFVEYLNGKISVSSIPGVGSRFKVTFPVEQLKLGTKPTPHHKPKPKETTISKEKLKKVLLVEDVPSNSDVVRILLKDICELEIAQSGEEAIDLVQKKRYAAILMDIDLGPGLSGIEAVKQIRSYKAYEKTPIIAVTALAMKGHREQFLSEGCSHYISKPFEAGELKQLVIDVISEIAN